MADITYNPVAGQPFSGPIVMKDGTGNGGPYAPQSMNIGGPLPLQSINAVSATGPGLMLDNQGVRNNHSIVVTTNGTVTGGNVQLQGSQDNVNWANLLTSAAAPLSATAPIIAATSSLIPFRFIRANITVAIAGGGTITAWIASAG